MKRRTPAERTARMAELERYRATVREGAPCPLCQAKRKERCVGRKRNHIEREALYRRWCDEQYDAEQLDRMLGRVRHG